MTKQKNKNVNSPRHGGVKQAASGCHSVRRWAQIVFFPHSIAKTRHTSPKCFLHQKNEKTRFYKSLQRAPPKKSGKNQFCVVKSQNAMNTPHVLKAHFSSTKTEKNDFVEERHKYAKRKKRELSEKRAVLKERPKYATQKKRKK